MITIVPITTFYDHLTRWEIFDGVDGVTVSPEMFPIMFKSMIQKLNSNEYIYIVDLSLFKSDFIIALNDCGFEFDNNNPKITDLENGKIKYLIGGENATFYNATIKWHGKKIEIFDANNYFPDRNKVLKSWGRHDKQRNARAYHRAFTDLHNIMGECKYHPMTISACAKQVLNRFQKFRLDNAHQIPVDGYETLENYIRPSYHGGICALKESYKEYGAGIVLDINSLYPYIMRYYPMPYNNPVLHQGAPDRETIRLTNSGSLYFWIHIRASFKLKKNHVACVRASGDSALLYPDGWLESSDWVDRATGEITHKTKKGNLVLCELFLTCTDFSLFLKSYDIEKIEYIDYMTMGTTKHLFADTIDYLYAIKNDSDDGRRAMAKILMNSISGNMARRTDYTNYYIKMTSQGVRYECKKYMGQTPSYVYIGSAITSYARQIIINAIITNYDRWIYSDTDSLHLTGHDIPDGLIISDALGAYKIEHTFERSIYYKLKMYGMFENNKYDFRLAGIPRNDTRDMMEKINADLPQDDFLMSILNIPLSVNIKRGQGFTYLYETTEVYINDLEEFK